MKLFRWRNILIYGSEISHTEQFLGTAFCMVMIGLCLI
jgi:hypothetical protein